MTIALHEIADGEVQVVPQEAKAEPEENAAVWDVPEPEETAQKADQEDIGE